MSTVAIVLVIIGSVYLLKPDIFQRWFWKKTAISQRLLSPEQNKVYMRILGAVLLCIGLYLAFGHQ